MNGLCKVSASLLAITALLIVLLSGACALSNGSHRNANVQITFPSQLGNAIHARYNLPAAPSPDPMPSVASGFDCYFVNISGPGMSGFDSAGNSSNNNPSSTNTFYPPTTNNSQYSCPFIGALSKIVGPFTGTQTITLSVPTGPQRIIQFIGMQTTGGCYPGTFQDFLTYVNTNIPSPLPGATPGVNTQNYFSLTELSRQTMDIYSDTNVSVTAALPPFSGSMPSGTGSVFNCTVPVPLVAAVSGEMSGESTSNYFNENIIAAQEPYSATTLTGTTALTSFTGSALSNIINGSQAVTANSASTGQMGARLALFFDASGLQLSNFSNAILSIQSLFTSNALQGATDCPGPAGSFDLSTLPPNSIPGGPDWTGIGASFFTKSNAWAPSSSFSGGNQQLEGSSAQFYISLPSVANCTGNCPNGSLFGLGSSLLSGNPFNSGKTYLWAEIRTAPASTGYCSAISATGIQASLQVSNQGY